MIRETIASTQHDQRVPAYIIVGFLGSGKTTLLGQLIEWCVEQDLKPGLIINEFGDVSIDGEEVRHAGLAMTELTNGCICCTAGDELVPALLDLVARPDVDLILLEATGLADPVDLLDELTDPFLWKSVVVGGIISVLDSQRFTELADDLVLARHQVEYADVLVMNKCDLITQDWREALKAFLPMLAPKAKVFEAENGFLYEGEEALLAHSLAIGRQRQIREMGEAKQHDHKEQHDHHHNLDEDHHHEHHGHAHESIHTVSFALDRPVDRTSFGRLLHDLPKTVYRAKGFVTFLGDQETYVFQHLPGSIRIKRFPLQDRALLRGIFIGKDLEKQGLALQLQRCQHAAQMP